jgi:hypothetical protein
MSREFRCEEPAESHLRPGDRPAYHEFCNGTGNNFDGCRSAGNEQRDALADVGLMPDRYRAPFSSEGKHFLKETLRLKTGSQIDTLPGLRMTGQSLADMIRRLSCAEKGTGKNKGDSGVDIPDDRSHQVCVAFSLPGEGAIVVPFDRTADRESLGVADEIEMHATE